MKDKSAIKEGDLHQEAGDMLNFCFFVARFATQQPEPCLSC